MPVQVDSVIPLIAIIAVAIVLVVGAWQKLHDLMAFEIAVEAYELLPLALVKPFTILLPASEIAAAAMLLYSPARPAGIALALLILLMVTAAVVINLLRGRRDVGCGCGGLEDEQPLSWLLVGRNAILALGLASGVLSNSRSMLWFDLLTVAAGAVCVYGLYVLVNQLVANQPRLERLRTAA